VLVAVLAAVLVQNHCCLGGCSVSCSGSAGSQRSGWLWPSPKACPQVGGHVGSCCAVWVLRHLLHAWHATCSATNHHLPCPSNQSPPSLARALSAVAAAGRPRVPPSSPIVFDVKLLYIPGISDDDADE